MTAIAGTGLGDWTGYAFLRSAAVERVGGRIGVRLAFEGETVGGRGEGGEGEEENDRGEG